MDNQVQEKIGQIQLIQQNMENFSMQKQQFQVQQTEIETALLEIKNTNTAYKIVGNIMVLTDKEQLRKDLEEKNEMLTIRVATIEKQEDKLRSKFEELQQEVMKSLEEKNTEKKKPKKQNDEE
jgi:prefoldin beta subunit